jgi:hemin uptake protein HemP
MPSPLGSGERRNASKPIDSAGNRVVKASTLLGERQSVDIEYNGQRYRLQTTKAGKLILTK